MGVKVEDKNTATVFVPEDQLSLAIGKDGRNVRLAAQLTGWKIDIKPTEVVAESAEGEPAPSEAEVEKKEEKKEEKAEEKPKKEKKSKKTKKASEEKSEESPAEEKAEVKEDKKAE